jgi:hypothetical protein
MKFGDIITIRRGGHPKEVHLPGSFREVQIRLLGAKGHRIYGELREDDPLAIPPGKKGECLWWERSIIIQDTTTKERVFMSKRNRVSASDPGLSALQLRLLSAMAMNPTDWSRTFNWGPQPGGLDTAILALIRRGLVRQNPETTSGWFLTPEGMALIHDHLERSASALDHVEQKQARTLPGSPCSQEQSELE